MPEIFTAEVSDNCHCLTPEITSTSPGSSDAENEKNAGKNKAVIHKGQKFAVAVAVAVVIATLILVIIVLSVYSTKPCLPCLSTVSAACPDFWIGYRGKCFYISKDEKNWSLSLKTCSLFNASLAVIDTQKELDFWVEIFHPLHYWFGLSREIKQVWKWYNGTEFKNQFAVRGEGFCAYMDGKGASSTICSMEKRFLCSRPESCSKSG
ncbi:C-type lectin domain family 2 member D-like isoform X2 [Pantherophis guttatus]|nr:C-type lectin domain family 2 member D-like isoform X2 [Pantherophis guttatus]XP_060547104.1 C-type lectin domain family 2 member D-like isoform X2 [Pantherophis guttatus]